MSTATTSSVQQPRTSHSGTVEGPSLSFGRLLLVELRKLVDTVAGRWVLGIIVLITLATLTLFVWFSEKELLNFGALLQVVTFPQALLLPIVGVLATTAEWSKRTGLITFTLEPRRLRVAVAKFIAAILLGLLAYAITVGVAALVFMVISATVDGPAEWGVAGWVLVGTFATIALGLAQGVGFGMLLGSTPLAIVAIYVLPTALTIVGQVVTSAQKVMPWIDPSLTQAPLTAGESLSGEQWAQLATSSGIWIVLPIVFGVVMLLRREVK